MLNNILLGTMLTVITTVIHGLYTASLVVLLRRRGVARWAFRGAVNRVVVLSALVLGLLLIAIVEAGIWASVYVRVGAIEGFDEAMYFSLVTFTTLGYGDITLAEAWRLLAALQAADGTITFGWTTALIFGAYHKLYIAEEA